MGFIYKKPRQKSKYLDVVIDKEVKIFKKSHEKLTERFILDFDNGYYELLRKEVIILFSSFSV